MNPKITLEGDVLEVSSRDYTNKAGEARTYRSCLFRLDGKVLKFTVSKDSFEAVKAFEGKTAVLVMELQTFGDNLQPSLSVVGTSAR